MNNVIGSKENLQELLFESGRLQKADKCRKARIITQGEGILPETQQKLGLNLALKSYFIVAQLHETYLSDANSYVRFKALFILKKMFIVFKQKIKSVSLLHNRHQQKSNKHHICADCLLPNTNICA
jgi:hypothetical protein